MRIVKGALREYNLKIPKIRDLRVTPYTVRKELIDFLGTKLTRSIVLDLFAGSGSLGIDALSCGARKVTFVDIHESSITKIRESLINFNLLGRGLLVLGSCEKFIESAKSDEFDIVFFTPPYQNLNLFLIPRILRILKNNGFLIFEFPPSLESKKLQNTCGNFEIVKLLNFGWSRIVILSPTPLKIDDVLTHEKL